MVLLECHNPPSPVFHNLKLLHIAKSPTALTPRLPYDSPVVTAVLLELRHNRSPFVSVIGLPPFFFYFINMASDCDAVLIGTAVTTGLSYGSLGVRAVGDSAM